MIMTKKIVVTTTQVIVRKYFVEVDDPEWACDGVVCNELEEYSYRHLTEDIISAIVVDEWPSIDHNDSLNAATMKYNPVTDEWEKDVMWPTHL
jgi:hypothetical protein